LKKKELKLKRLLTDDDLNRMKVVEKLRLKIKRLEDEINTKWPGLNGVDSFKVKYAYVTFESSSSKVKALLTRWLKCNKNYKIDNANDPILI